jgi:photosystem II stability/assembly factor-like uncharacterized protein
MLVAMVSFITPNPSSAQWKEVYGIEGGQVERFVKVGNNILAAGQFQGVFVSTNGGSTWARSWNNGLSPTYRGCRDFSSNRKKVYLADGVNLFLTADSGVTWRMIPSFAKSNANAVLVQDSSVLVSLVGWLGGSTIARTTDDFKTMTLSNSIPGSVSSITGTNRLLFACTLDSIYFSSNNGATWSPTNAPSELIGSIYRLAAEDSLVVATGNNGAYRSTNGGKDWNRIVGPTGLCCLCLDSSYWYVANNGVWRSSDHGGSWAETGDLLISFPFGTLAYTNVKSVHSADGIVLCSPGGPGIFKSTDNGSIWQVSNSGFNVPQTWSMAVTGDTAYAAVHRQGIFRTTDRGETWQNDIDGMADDRFFSIAANRNVVFVGTRTVVSVSIDAGRTWATCTNAPNGEVFCMAFNGDTLYAAFLNNMVLQISKTTDRGQSWTPLGVDGLPTSAYSVSGMAFTDSSIYVGFLDGGFFASRNGGVSWQSLASGLTDANHPNASVYDVVTDGSNLFTLANDYLFMSSDRGLHWKDIGIEHGYPLDTAGHTKIAIHGTNLFVTYRGRLCHSANYGKKWDPVGEGLNSAVGGAFPGARTLVNTASQIYATSFNCGPLWHRNLSDFSLSTSAQVGPTSITLAATAVGGNRDTTVLIKNTGMDTLIVRDIVTTAPEFLVTLRSLTIPPGQAYLDTIRFTPSSAVGYSANIVVVSNSVSSPDTVRVSTSGVVSIAHSEATPKEFSIDQNYPNPFNPSTTIRYGLPSSSHVTLAVFNTLGQQVAIVQNGEQEAGYHEVRFDGSNLSSGVYFYRIQAENFVATKRLLLLR